MKHNNKLVLIKKSNLKMLKKCMILIKIIKIKTIIIKNRKIKIKCENIIVNKDIISSLLKG